MEENALISALQDTLAIDGTAVSAVVGALVTTIFLRRDTSVKEFEKIKAGKFEEVIDSLLKSGKMSYFEFYKCKNFLKIAKIADKVFKESNSSDNWKKDHVFPDNISCSRIHCSSNSNLQIPSFPDILRHSFRVSV